MVSQPPEPAAQAPEAVTASASAGEAASPEAPPAPAKRSSLLSLAADGATVGASAAFGLWLGDVLVLRSSRSGTTPSRWFLGIGAALFVALTTAIVVGALAAVALAPTVEALRRRARALALGLRSGEPRVVHEVAVQSLTAATLLPAALWVSFRLSIDVPAELARAESIAAVLALSHAALAGLVLLVWPSWSHAARRVVEGAARLAPLRRLLGRWWGGPLAVFVLGAAVAVKLALGNREELGALPWREALPLPGLAVGLAVGVFLVRSTSTWVGNFALGLLAAALVGGSVASVSLTPASTSARKVAFEESLAGRAGYAAWTLAFDFDRDGQLSVLGGGDCAPFDPRIHTGAIDVPGNGIDEDCDGVDLRPLVYKPRPAPFAGQANLPHRPSIVLVTIDALAARRLTSIGGGRELMPNIDALAAKGAVFTDCFAEGPATRLSFPAMFTSRWDSQLRQEYAPTHPYPLAATERQMQDILDDAGYETVAVLPARYFDPRRWPSMTRGFQHVDASPVAAGRHNARDVTDAAVKAVTEARERPLYLWVHYYDAHGPYAVIPGIEYPNGKSDEALYDGALSLIDREAGRLLDAIEKREGPTYVILTADHGSLFGAAQGSRRHHYGDDLSTAVLNVPLLVVGPGIAPRKIDSLASTMDILPTLVDLLGVKPKATLEGQSLWGEILNGQPDPNRLVFGEVYLGERDFQGRDPLEQVSVRDATWDLSLDRVKGTYHLFDYKNDYLERHDLYEDEGKSVHGKRLRATLGGFVEAFHRRAPGTAVLAPTEGER